LSVTAAEKHLNILRAGLIVVFVVEPEWIDRFDQVPLRGGFAQWGCSNDPNRKGTS